MRDRRKDIKKRIAKRKQARLPRKDRSLNEIVNQPREYDTPYPYNWPAQTGKKGGKDFHPLFRKDLFLLKLLASACLLLLVAIMYKNPSDKFQPVRNVVERVMKDEFQFASIASWYEKTFGKPLALFPEGDNGKRNVTGDYALPAAGSILEGFDSDNQGVTIQTTENAFIEAIQEGLVIYAGDKPDHGKTVIIQHPDKSESWYAELGEIHVKNYEQVEAGEPIGKVSTTKAGESGEFYFAIKKGENFIDPVQVIQFE